MSDPKDREEIKVPCDVYSRVVGYITPVRQWNTGKQQEFGDRLEYDVSEEIEPPDSEVYSET